MGESWSYCLVHHGILGQKWGKRNGPPYPLSPSDHSADERVFISGSSKTQFNDNPYYRKKLPRTVRTEIKKLMKNKDTIMVGDAPGIDRQVQDYLNKKKYKNVEVYSPGKESRYLANKEWKNEKIDDPDHEPMSPEWLAKKDKVMSDRATKGIAVILDEGSKATRNNIDRMLNDNKDVKIYQLFKDKKLDRWVNSEDYIQLMNRPMERLQRAAKSKKDVDDIVNSLSKTEKAKLGIEKGDKEYLSIEQGEHVLHRSLKKMGDIPVSFFDLLDDGDTINLALATRSGDQYRGKGYGSEAAKQSMEWINKHPAVRNNRDIVWGVREDNTASINIAKKMGFVEDPSSRNNGWVNYINRGK